MIITKVIGIRNFNPPPNKTHIATRYTISKNYEFTNILIDEKDDGEYLTRKGFDLDFGLQDVYYARLTLYFNDGSYYGPTRPIMLTKNNDSVSHSSSIIATPTIEINQDPNNVELNGLIITGSDIVIFKGLGNHESSDWVIRDMNESIVWSSMSDKTNLTSISIPINILSYDNAYIIELRYNTNDGHRSNWGKKFIKTRKAKLGVDDLYLVPSMSTRDVGDMYIEATDIAIEAVNDIVSQIIYNTAIVN